MNRHRAARLTGAVAAVPLTLLLTATPALANHRLGPSEGEQGGQGLAAAETIALFVLLPLAILVVIGGLAWLPTLRQGTRYRPQRGWDAPPIWFGGPSDPQAALAQAGTATTDENRGGAHGSW